MNGFDLAAIELVNSFVGRWPEFDRFVAFLTWQNILKGGVFATLIFWAWFSHRPRAKEVVVATLYGSIGAVAIARILAAALPFRTRPLFNPALHVRTIDGANAGQLIDWSAFPSDHAALFLGLATGLGFISVPLGVASGLYATAIILFPRFYAGIHHATDLIAGGVLGVCLALFSCWQPLRERLARPLLALERWKPALFYAAMFLVCFEIAELFEGVRNSAESAWRILARHHAIPVHHG
ncbi:MAG: phosphatase PAP2 family protein [Deltaproteobacteria bacterium]